MKETELWSYGIDYTSFAFGVYSKSHSQMIGIIHMAQHLYT